MSSTDAALFANIPDDLKAIDQWVCWRVEEREGGPTKVPYNARTGGGGMSTQPDTWASYEECREAMVFRDYNGVGYVFGPDCPFCGIDLDDCIDDDGHIYPAAQKVIDQLASYSEISPSGRGVKVFVRAKKTPDMPRSSISAGDDFKKIEIYDRFRYFTVTGNHLPGTPLTINDPGAALKIVYDRYFPPPVPVEKALASSIDGFDGADSDLIQKAAGASNGAAFRALWNGDTAAYEHDESRADLALCNHIAFYTGPDRSRIDLLFRSSGLMREKWDSRRGDETYGQKTIAKALEGKTEFYSPRRRSRAIQAPKPHAQPDDFGDPSEPPDPVAASEPILIPEPTDWEDIAERFAESITVGGVVGLLCLNQQWWRFGAGAWRVATQNSVEQAIRRWLQKCVVPKPTKNDPDATARMPVNKKNVGEITAALSGYLEFMGSPPCWISGTGPDPRFIASFQNGWIDAKEYARRRAKEKGAKPVLNPPDPRLFTLGATDYDYDEDAECPNFKKFVAQVVTPENTPTNEADVEQIRQWFGYTMIPWNGMEKTMFYEGHPCSGKGTMIKVHKAILGKGRWSATTVTKLGSRFGLEPIANKMAAFDADAHITRSSDAAAALETIKNITGNDEVSVDRKGILELGDVHIVARITFAFNEAPSFPDGGASFRRRLLTIRYPNNYEDDPDTTLKDRCCAERQGIARWAIDGLADLIRTGAFTESMTSIDAREDFVRNSTPILIFIDECCELSPLEVTTAADLHHAHVLWCQDNGSRPYDRNWLMRKIYKGQRGVYPEQGVKNNSCRGLTLTPEMKRRIDSYPV